MRHTAIWIDHDAARVFHIEGAAFDKDTVHSAHHHIRRHDKADEARFFHEALAVLGDSEGVLIMGPSVTKLRFLRYVEKHSPAVAGRVIGIETADHPTDRQLAAHIRHYFHSDSPRLGLAS